MERLRRLRNAVESVTLSDGAVDLAAGPNRLTLTLPPAAAAGGRDDSGGTTTLTLTYDAASDGAGAPGTKSVRLVWLSSADGDGSFEVPPAPHAGWDVPHTAADGAARLRTAGRLMQAATAEMMARQGLGRRTFRLAEGVTHLTLAGMPTTTARRMGGHELWSAVYAAADGCARRDDYIDVAVMSFTCWDAAARKRRLYDATPAVPMPAHRTPAVAVPTPAPVTLNDLSRALGGLLHPSSSAAAAVSAAPPPGSDGAVVVLTAAAGGSAPAGRGPLFTAGPDGRLTIRVGRDGGGGGGGGRGAGLGHVGYYADDRLSVAAIDTAGNMASWDC
ncbi:hypothetical protein I4F81_009577 [Pyropia yezoensis]|uniref:Uncharacterized protein n=1 Tax=Pyropia yezoensis TaxID=2788 RepID=A0ACC3CA46_PYRYE|nr:hypothetical protein I4F81_009577 [Neopyropia yezoensis]